MTSEEIEEALFQKIKAICEERKKLNIDPICCSIKDIGFTDYNSGMAYLESLITKGRIWRRPTIGADRYQPKRPLLF